MKDERIYQLDLFRFIAALSVVCFHYFHMGPFFGLYATPARSFEPVAKYGYLGVQAFFIISGFVIAMSANGKSARAFLRGRAVRLLPLFWVACLLTFAVTSCAGPAALKVGISSLAGSLIMLPAVVHQLTYVDGVYWTLAFEWIFYAVIALTLTTGLYEQHLNKLLSGWLAVSAIMLLIPGKHGLLRLLTVAEYSPYFVAGVCFYHLYTRRAAFADLFNLALGFMLAIKWSQKHVQEFQSIYPLSETVVVGLVCVMFVAFLLLAAGKLECLNRKTFGPLGALTYGLYLTHQNIGYVILGASGATIAPSVWRVAAVSGGALVLAILLHRYVEQPVASLLRVKRGRSSRPGWQPLNLDDVRFDHE